MLLPAVNVGDNRSPPVKFDDILDLVPQSLVKKDGIVVGRSPMTIAPATSGRLTVKMVVRDNVKLSGPGAYAAVQQTALLGREVRRFDRSRRICGRTGVEPGHLTSPGSIWRDIRVRGPPPTSSRCSRVVDAKEQRRPQSDEPIAGADQGDDVATVQVTGPDGKAYLVN